MTYMGLEVRSLLGALALCALGGTAGADPVALTVEFSLTDLDGRPLPGVPVRLVLGSDPGWQRPGAGHRFATDAGGAHRLATPVVLAKERRKLPTNFLSSLVSRPQQTDHLRVAAELPYMTFAWLYAVDVHRFPGGEVLLEGFSVYTRDGRGEFTTRAKQESGGWMMADLGGLALTHPGHEPGNVVLQPDPADPARRRWTLQIAFKQSPAPVRR